MGTRFSWIAALSLCSYWFATWIRFRWETRHLDQVASNKLTSFRLPLGFIGVTIWAIFPIALCMIVVVLAIIDGSTTHLVTFMVVAIIGESLYSKDALMRRLVFRSHASGLTRADRRGYAFMFNDASRVNIL